MDAREQQILTLYAALNFPVGAGTQEEEARMLRYRLHCVGANPEQTHSVDADAVRSHLRLLHTREAADLDRRDGELVAARIRRVLGDIATLRSAPDARAGI